MSRAAAGRAVRAVAAPMTYLALAVFAHLPAFNDLARRTRCACGDQPQTDWFLAWTPHAVFSGQAPWTSSYLSVPSGVNLTWNTLMPLPGLLMSPVTALAGPLATHTLLAVLAIAGSATAMWWAAARWASWWLARFAAGLLYAFSPYLVAQGGGHLNLELVALPPVMLVLADEVLVRQRLRAELAGGLLGLVALAQFLTTEEVLASMAVVAAAGLGVLSWQHRGQLQRRRLRHASIGLAAAAGVLTLGAAWPLEVQFFGPGRLSAHVQDVSPYAADVLGVVVPSAHEVIGSSLTAHWAGNEFENGSYLGVPLLLAVGFLAWRYRSIGVVRFAAVLAVVTWVLSLGDHLHFGGVRYDVPLPFGLLSRLPVLHNLVSVRLSLYVVLCAALVVAVGLDRLHREGWTPRRRWRVWAAAAACAVPLVPTLPYTYKDAGTPKYFTSTAIERIPLGGVAFTYPVPRFPSSAAMQWQALSGFRYRSLGGYVITRGPQGGGTFAGSVTTWERVVNQAPLGRRLASSAHIRQALLAEMAALHARAVLVADVQGAEQVDAYVAALLGRPPDEHTGGVSAWYLRSGPAAG